MQFLFGYLQSWLKWPLEKTRLLICLSEDLVWGCLLYALEYIFSVGGEGETEGTFPS